MKVQRFLDSLKIGPVGTMAQEEYFEEQVEKERLRQDSIMRDTMGVDPFDDESLANPEENLRRIRLAMYLEIYNYDVKYIPGYTNFAADLLTRL